MNVRAATVLALVLCAAPAGGPLPPLTAAQRASAPPVQVPQTIRVGVLRDSSYTVVPLLLDTYVARVLAGEAVPGSSPAALEALAITVRTFALANQGRHRADGFDLCDQTHCQVLRDATPATERAARATSGQVLLYAGRPASVFYSASCGGHTELASAVWPGSEDPPYLPSKEDAACEGEPHWTDDITTAELRRSLAAAGFTGTLREMRVESRDDSGRVARLALDGLTPSHISGQDLRVAAGRMLGWQHVKSAAFDLRRTGDVYHFTGHGSGHGVGLCVIGSAKLAAAGESAPRILNRYFPGLTIATAPTIVGPSFSSGAPPPVPGPSTTARGVSPAPVVPRDRGVIVSLPDGDEGDEDVVSALAARSRDELAKALGLGSPQRLSLRFHPTVTDYERATGQSWFTSAVVVRGDVHFVPLASLRERGLLERMIRRQMVHVLIDPMLANRPAWVREGAALHFGDAIAGTAQTTGGRVTCPTDAELLHPLSPGALSDATSRARRCFDQQIAAGRSWREVR